MYKAGTYELKKFFNTSGVKYRELGLKDVVKTESDDKLLEILASDGMLIKRPIAFDGKNVLIGFKEEEWKEKLLNK
ncbi:Arsenate reductase and related proteins%2C glutaredoxin family [uncultured Clostridium sp.]|nr:Arsenate reductase and related proteins%2C glutaredoxin family [uncultured Clostridium sp.]SCI85815.1 Arsenate reductase and related proteins%2C glutaredoxin family [uncultured Clostridium sp.]